MIDERMTGMKDARIQALEDRFALNDLFLGYLYAVDKLTDIDGLLSLFTEDAIYDLSGIGLAQVKGHDGIRGFFEPVFADMTHHAHYGSNFVVDRLEGDDASIRAYVNARGISGNGNTVHVHVRYFLDCKRTANGWKIARFFEDALMPLPGSLQEIHGDR
jgi:ketosteroid isomerase-like protein